MIQIQVVAFAAVLPTQVDKKNITVALSIAKFAKVLHVAAAHQKKLVAITTRVVVILGLHTQFRHIQLFLKLSFIERTMRCTEMGTHFKLPSLWKGTQLDKKRIKPVTVEIAKLTESFHVATVDSQRTPRKGAQKHALPKTCHQLLMKLFFIERAVDRALSMKKSFMRS